MYISNIVNSMKRLEYLLASIIIAVVFVLFFNSQAMANRLVFALDIAPERLIPIKIKNPQTFPVSMQIFQGLFDLNEEGEVIPCIVEKWKTVDYQTWVFKVRKGIYFHRSPIFKNGTREVTAYDVLYSLTRFCSSESYNAFLLMDSVKGAADYNQGNADRVEGLSVKDKYTIQIKLMRPEPFFLNRLSTALISVFPVEGEKEEYAEKMGLSMAVSTGPYMLESRTASEIILKKNRDYWDQTNQPNFDEIVFRVITNDQTRFLNLRKGGIDIMVLPSSLFTSVFNRDGTLRDFVKNRYQMKSIATFNSHLIGINTKAINNANLRRAMFWGTNREEMINYILYGFAEETGGPVPPGIAGYRPPFKQKLFDPEKAKYYLKKSNYKGEPLTLLMHDLANSEQISQIFQAQMANIGIQIVLEKMDFNSVINRMIKGEYQLFSMFAEYVLSSPEPILINFFSSSKIPIPNVFQFSEPSVDAMLENLYKIENKRKSLEYCADIESRIMKEVPGVFLYRQNYIILYPRNMAGLEVSGNNHYFLEKLRVNK